MKLYKTCGNRILSECDLKTRVCSVLGTDIETLISHGVIETAEPTVEDCVLSGSVGLAVILYEKLHDCDIQTAYQSVEDIKKNLKE